jgi:hypothetical protein
MDSKKTAFFFQGKNGKMTALGKIQAELRNSMGELVVEPECCSEPMSPVIYTKGQAWYCHKCGKWEGVPKEKT